MADTNKIKYGIRNVTLFPATIAADGSATYGTAIPVPGAVSLSLDQQGETNKFYADNTVYWSGYSDNGLSGDLLDQDIRECLHWLGEITGEITTDNILGEIFAHFCIGKGSVDGREHIKPVEDALIKEFEQKVKSKL